MATAPILFQAFDRIGAAVPLEVRRRVRSLPRPRFRHPNEVVVAQNAGPEIAYPLDGVDVDLGIKVHGDRAALHQGQERRAPALLQWRADQAFAFQALRAGSRTAPDS